MSNEVNGTKRHKFNAVDVVIVIVLAAAICFLGYKYVFRGEAAVAPTAEITYKVKCSDVDRATLENILTFEQPTQLIAGDVFVGGAYVVEIEYSDSDDRLDFHTTTNSAVEVASLENRADIIFTITATVEDKANIELNTQEIRAGKTNYYVKTKFYELSGTVLSVDWS